MGETVTIDEVKEAVREVVREELVKMFLAITPEVDDEEMPFLEQLLKTKSDGEDTEGIDWLGE